MTAGRRPNAPRLIEWTGERCVPWTPDIQVVYEHFHRYLWAAQLTAGRRVLDLASGEGFGAALLSETAAAVTGVDIDATAVEHAQLNYTADNLEYRTADARDLGQFDTASFDVVVAFELIEHIVEQEQVLAEIRRVLMPGGLLIVSTPDRSGYDQGPGNENPFHAKELARDEFDALLGTHFAYHRLWAQHVIEGSAFRAIEPTAPVDPGTQGDDASSFLIQRSGDEWQPAIDLPVVYMVALASDTELPVVPRASSLGDAQLAMTRSRLTELADRLNEEIVRRDAEITRRDAEIVARGEAIQTLERDHQRLLQTIQQERSRLQRFTYGAFTYRKAAALRLTEQTNAWARASADAAADAAAQKAALEMTLRGELAYVHAQLEWSDLQLRRVQESILFRATMRVKGKLISLLGGEQSTVVHAAQASLRTAWRLVGNRPAEIAQAPSESESEPEPEPEPESDRPEPELELKLEEIENETSRLASPSFAPVDLEPDDDPVISIVMPLYAGAELTHRALETIRDHTVTVPYEVIIINDGDDPATTALLEQVSGARILENDTNLGYLRSVNRAAQTARGRWLVLANNDIEVLPNWADELLDCGESADDIAIVSPMYLQPDGLISEAGGIIWDDASGHNYGRGDWPDGWRYGWRREVDYGSAAALLVRADVWRDIGGFDERFLPMYYEDADLCFAARARGYRVMYEPQARVVHKEGSSAGTDEGEGHKRHQALNRPRFREKWEEVLTRDHLSPPEQLWDAWAGATARRGDRVVFIDHRTPFWDKEAGALRTLEILRSLMDTGHHVTFLPDNGANTEPYATQLQRMGIEVMYGPDLLTQLSMVVAPYLKAAIVSRPGVAARYMSLLRRHAPDAELIYDTVDLHWVREAREAALAVGHHEAELLTQEALWTQSLELALIRAADVTLVATAPERTRVEAEVPGATIRVLPTINPVREDAPGLSGRNGIIFVGGFQHTPNVDAVLRLINGVMPVVWQALPDVKLRVIGADVPKEIEALASDKVEILGWVQDVDPLLDAARVTVAPLSYGAGMKGKITQALAFGVPVVTTPVGAEGLEAGIGEALLVGDDDAEIARHAIQVLTDDELWQRLADAGRDLVGEQCSPEVVASVLEELLGRADRALEPR